MCRSLRIRPSGFYAWLHNPMSKRAKEEAPQIELIRKVHQHDREKRELQQNLPVVRPDSVS